MAHQITLLPGDGTVMHPDDDDCIVATKLFGDILSDLEAGLVGGFGVVAGANIQDDYAVSEAVHGSAPDIAGQGIRVAEHVEELQFAG